MSDPRFVRKRLLIQRRAFLAQTGVGLGAAALSMLLLVLLVFPSGLFGSDADGK